MMHHRSQTFVSQLRNLGESPAAIAAALIDPQGPHLSPTAVAHALHDTEGLHWPAQVVAHALYAPEGAHLPLHTVAHALSDETEGLGLPLRTIADALVYAQDHAEALPSSPLYAGGVFP